MKEKNGFPEFLQWQTYIVKVCKESTNLNSGGNHNKKIQNKNGDHPRRPSWGKTQS